MKADEIKRAFDDVFSSYRTRIDDVLKQFQAGQQDAKQLVQSVDQAAQALRQDLQSAGMLSKDVVEKTIGDPEVDDAFKLGTYSMARVWNHNDKQSVLNSEQVTDLVNRDYVNQNSLRQTIATLELGALSYLRTVAMAQATIKTPNETIRDINGRVSELTDEIQKMENKGR